MVEIATPLTPSVLNLTAEEIEAYEGMIDKGALPRNWMDLCAHARDKNIFGTDFKIDRDGNPIEQGLGSPGNMTANSVAAYEKWCKDEPDFERKLARMKKLLAEQQIKRDGKGDEAERERRKRMVGR
jgi:hypothetical protein